MANSIKPSELGAAIERELTVYHESVTERINSLSEKAVKALVKKTKATAPVGARGSYKKRISSKLLKSGRNGNTYVWYVKAPDYRLTHLLVKGHATKNGGRTKADPFLSNALGQVLPEYERGVEEAVRSGT